MLRNSAVDSSRAPADPPFAVVDARRKAEHARLRALMPYLKALAIYLSSRLVVFLAIAFGKIYIPPGGGWLAGSQWYYSLLRWDSEWYRMIATEGYAYNSDPTQIQTVVFYPLYPLLSRTVAATSGLSVASAMLVVANVAALVAIVLLFKLVREEFGDTIALPTVAFLSFFPTSFFLSAGYTEPLTLMWIACFFLALKRERFLVAAAMAGLAVATRASGIVLLPVLLWELWSHREPRQFARDVVPCAILATSGLWIYMLYLAYAFGNPMAFSDGQMAFHNGTTMATRLMAALELAPFARLNLTEASPSGLDNWFVLIFLAVIVRAWFRLSFAMTLFAVGIFLLPYLTLSGGPAGFTSTARFNLVSFPLFIVMAELGNKIPWLLPSLIGMLGGLLFIYSALFAQGQWVG
jgi:Dolichyl-phosphate-mannose-protein mannosyltransferase